MSTSVVHAGGEKGERKCCCSLPGFLKRPSRKNGPDCPSPTSHIPNPAWKWGKDAGSQQGLTGRLNYNYCPKIRWTHSSSLHLLSPSSSFLCDLNDSRSQIWHNWRCCKFQLVLSIQFLTLPREQRACSTIPQSVSYSHHYKVSSAEIQTTGYLLSGFFFTLENGIKYSMMSKTALCLC